MKNKGILIAIIVAILLAVGGVYFFVASSSSPEISVEETDETEVETLSPEEIGLEIEVSADNHYVTLIFNKASGIKRIEGEVAYEADIPLADRVGSDAEDKVTQSFGIEADLQGQSTYETKPKELGTCSSGRCRFDTGITKIDVILKVTKTNGKVYSVEATKELE